MKKIILFFVCIACIGCQQSGNVDRLLLKGTWQNAEDPNCRYSFRSNNYVIRYQSEDPNDNCYPWFTYELYNNQIVSSAYYYRPVEDSQGSYYIPDENRIFTVVYNCSLQSDSILHLTLKSCDMDANYVHICGWTPQKSVKLIRITNNNEF